ncbi:MAG: hypothetical protein ACJ741_06705 [Pyrinomonadaceae bacterium]
MRPTHIRPRLIAVVVALLCTTSTTQTLGTAGFLAPKTGVSAPLHLVRFTVNPKTGAVTASVIR